MGDIAEVRGTVSASGAQGLMEAQTRTACGSDASWTRVCPVPVQACVALEPALSDSSASSSASIVPLACPGQAVSGSSSSSLALAVAAVPGVVESLEPFVDNSILCNVCPENRRTLDGVLEIWTVVTDRGGDIYGGKQRVAQFTALEVWRWFYECDCVAHSYQIMSLNSMKGMRPIMALLGLGGCSYVSALAIPLHCVRENVADFTFDFRKEYPDEVADSMLSRIPPQPITGRWGQCTLCENYVLSFTVFAHFAASLHRVLSTKSYYKTHLEQMAAGRNDPIRKISLHGSRGLLFLVSCFLFLEYFFLFLVSCF